MGAWMVYACLVGGLMGLAALPAEWLCRAYGRPGRWVWTAAMGAALLLPVVAVLRGAPAAATVASSSEPAQLLSLPEAIALLNAAPARVSTVLDEMTPLLVAGWIASSLVFALALIVGLLRLSARSRRWPGASVADGPVLLSEDFGPALIGILDPRVVVPRWMLDFDAEKLRLAVLHEREHHAAGDVPLLLAGAMALLIAPWNPALWWQHRRLRAAVELDCDDRVIRRGASRAQYGRLLLQLGAGASGAPLVAAAFSKPTSVLERRLTMIGRGMRRPGRAASVALASVAAAAVAMACEMAPPTGPEASAVAADTEVPVGAVTVSEVASAKASEEAAATLKRMIETQLRAVQEGAEAGTYRVGEDRGGTYSFDADAPAETDGALRRVETARLREVGDPSVAEQEAREVRLRAEAEARGAAGGLVRKREGPSGPPPLVYLDGVRLEGPEALSAVDPSTIDRVEIVKGPAAARYGPEASGGVIQIFTKPAA